MLGKLHVEVCQLFYNIKTINSQILKHFIITNIRKT